MDFEVVWSESAVLDLEAAVRQMVAAGGDLAAAEDLRVDVLESVDILARFPFIGPAYERDRTGRAREIICRRHRIFYRVKEPQRRVEILTIWHGSRREPKLPG